MTQQLYIKTDGPIPEGCDYLTAGKVYEVRGGPEEGSPCGLVEIIDDNGFAAYPLTNAASCGERCAYLAEGATWHFCDASGNPVPAPWEGEKECDCRCCMSCSYEMSPSQWWEHAACPKCASPHDCVRPDKAPTPINYRVHAEALAEALNQAVTSMQDSGYSNSHLAVRAAREALAAFDQDRGKV